MIRTIAEMKVDTLYKNVHLVIKKERFMFILFQSRKKTLHFQEEGKMEI